MKRRIIALLTAALLINSICLAELPEPEFGSAEMIIGEHADGYVLDADIYYASSDGSGTEAVRRSLLVTPGESIVRRLVEEMLTPPGNTGLRSPAAGVMGIIGIEECDGFVNVNLSADMAELESDEERAVLFDTIGRTLLNLDGVSGVNIMLNSVQEAVYGVPSGVMTALEGDEAALPELFNDEWEKMQTRSVSRTAAVYFPGGNGLFMVPRLIEIEVMRDNCAQMLLNAMDGSSESGGLWLNMAAPATGKAPVAGTEYVNEAGLRLLDIEVSQGYADELALRGVGQWQMAAAFTLTVCTFVPGIDGIRLIVEGEAVTEAEIKGVTRNFEGGIMRREDFADTVGGISYVCFPGEDGMLHKVKRVTSQRRALSPYSAMLQLVAGPVESDGDVLPCIPEGVSAEDILGIAIDDGTATVNLSGNFYRLCQMMDEEAERMTVYSIVNTLCLMHGVNMVQFLIEGEKIDTLSENIYLGAPLMANYSIISE